MKLTSLLIFLMLNIAAYGKDSFGLKINLGISRVTAVNDYKEGSQKFPLMPSGQCGVFYNSIINNKSIIGTELLMLQIEGKENYTYSDGSSIIIRRNLSYLGIPVYYGYKTKNRIVNVGLQFNYLISRTEQKKGKENVLQEVPFNWATSTPNIDKYDYGLKLGIILNRDKKFEIEGAYYHGLNNIWYSEIKHQGNWKVKQLTFGLRYKFSKQ
jgi:hypothetical protein